MIHTFEFSGKYIALDVESGAVHILDKSAFYILRAEDPYALGIDRDTVDEILSELRELESSGALNAPEPEPVQMGQERSPIKSLCLHVAHDCNLRCKYCFADTGEFMGERMLMPFETAKAAMDFLVLNSMSRHNLEVDFFGGEPLLNMDVVRRTVDYGRSLEVKHNKHINFTITTNGVGLTDDIIDYLNDNMFNIVISLDGRREVHNALRPTVNGKPSYDITLKNAKKLIGQRGDGEYYIRGTFTNLNLDFSEDVKALYNEGFDAVSIEPVVLDDNSPYALRKEHLERICSEYDKLAQFVIDDKKRNGSLNFFHFNIDLSHGPCLKRRIKGCGAGFEYVAIAPNGDIYPCHQFVGDETHRMGNVLNSTFDRDMALKFAGCNIFTKEGCKDCFAKYFCSGGCSANAHKYNGSIYKPHALSCALMKKRAECAIGIFAEGLE